MQSWMLKVFISWLIYVLISFYCLDSEDLDEYVYRDKPKHSYMEADHHYYPYHQPHYSHYSSTDTEGCESYYTPYGEKSPSRRPVLRSMISDIPPSIQEINSRKAGLSYNTFYYSHILQSGDEGYTCRRRKKSTNHTKKYFFSSLNKDWLLLVIDLGFRAYISCVPSYWRFVPLGYLWPSVQVH